MYPRLTLTYSPSIAFLSSSPTSPISFLSSQASVQSLFSVPTALLQNSLSWSRISLISHPPPFSPGTKSPSPTPSSKKQNKTKKRSDCFYPFLNMMRRSSARKPAVVPSSVATSNVAGTKAAAKELERIDLLFGQYADKNEDFTIGPEGVERLCQDLGVDPTDIRILLLAWKLQAARQGYFTLEEWRRGLRSMRVDTIDKLKKTLPVLQQEVANLNVFRDFYTFAFQYCLTEPRQKTLDLETASQMLELVLGNRPHVPQFIQFLQEQTEYKVMNLDQWTAFLRFCEEIDHELSTYDESQAWPLLLDNYVEWARKRFSR